MTTLKYIVSDAIERHHLLERQRPVLVGVSGGADSVCLLHLLKSLGYNVVAVHCNFHLRGDESERDMRFTEDLCFSIGVHLHIVHFDVEAYCAEHGVSVEMACRDLRYAEFMRLIDSEGYQAVAVAHHADDNVETMLLNMLRGTGITGLAAMQWSTERRVVRPLLDVTRAQILGYLAENHLDYITDSTNASNDYRRNRLRNVIIPEIEKLFPGATSGLMNTVAHLRDNLYIYRDAVTALQRRYVSDDGSVAVDEIIDSESNPHAVLHELLYPLGFTDSQIHNVIDRHSTSGAIFTTLDGSGTYNLSHGILRPVFDRDATVVEFQQFTEPVSLGGVTITPRVISRRDFHPKRDANTIYLSLGSLPRQARWTLRTWREGDRIRPFGMRGSTLVSDIMRDAHLDEQQKRSTLILLCDEIVVWVVGLKASDHFRVGPSDTEILCLTTSAR